MRSGFSPSRTSFGFLLPRWSSRNNLLAQGRLLNENLLEEEATFMVGCFMVFPVALLTGGPLQWLSNFTISSLQSVSLLLNLHILNINKEPEQSPVPVLHRLAARVFLQHSIHLPPPCVLLNLLVLGQQLAEPLSQLFPHHSLLQLYLSSTLFTCSGYYSGIVLQVTGKLINFGWYVHSISNAVFCCFSCIIAMEPKKSPTVEI